MRAAPRIFIISAPLGAGGGHGSRVTCSLTKWPLSPSKEPPRGWFVPFSCVCASPRGDARDHRSKARSSTPGTVLAPPPCMCLDGGSEVFSAALSGQRDFRFHSGNSSSLADVLNQLDASGRRSRARFPSSGPRDHESHKCQDGVAHSIPRDVS